MPDTEQMLDVFDVKITGLLDAPPVADTVPVPPTVMLGAAPKVMVCGATGVTLPEGDDAAPGPTLLVALTVNVYAVPLVRPVTVMLVHGAVQVPVTLPGELAAV